MGFTAFLIAAALLAVTPGPGLAYVVARAVAGGRAEGLASCAGAAVGGLVHVGAAAFGLSLLIARSAVAFDLLKWVGVVYLLVLGVRMLRQAGRETDVAAEHPPESSAGVDDRSEAAGASRGRRVRRAAVQGVVVEALNVKTALFFLAFLPQFVDPALPAAPQLALLGWVCVGMNTAVDVLAVLGAARLSRIGGDGARRGRWLTRLSGGTMIGLAAWLAMARRPA